MWRQVLLLGLGSWERCVHGFFSLINMNPAPLQKCTGLINEILIFLVWCFSDFTALTGIRNKHRHQLLAKNKGPGEAFAVVFCGVPEVALPVPRSEVVTEPSLSLPAVGLASSRRVLWRESWVLCVPGDLTAGLPSAK